MAGNTTVCYSCGASWLSAPPGYIHKCGNCGFIMTKEFTNDAAENVSMGAIKYDAGKAPIYRGAISYFPRAISSVAAVSAFGASKYAWGGWCNVPNGFDRYSDAMVRHLTEEGKGESLDSDSGLLHATHVAWNALARLEFLLKEQEQVA